MKARRLASKVGHERRRLRSYYRECDPGSIHLPERPTQRQFRIAMRKPDGKLRFVKIDDRVRDAKTLASAMARFAPHHVYFTTSTWLDPQRLGPRDFKKRGKAGYPIAHNVFLDQGLYFDIDVAGDLATAAHHLVVLRDLLRERWGFRQFRGVYSGSKGFHLYADDFKLASFVKEVESDPRKREAQHPLVKAQFTEAALHAGIAVDAAVTLDPRRVLRVPGSVHGKTLNLCEQVDLARVESFVPHPIPSEGRLRRPR